MKIIGKGKHDKGTLAQAAASLRYFADPLHRRKKKHDHLYHNLSV